MARDLNIRITATDDASPTLAKVDGLLDAIDESAQKTGKATAAWKLAMDGAEETGRRIVGSLQDSLKAYGEQETALVKLRTALEAQGTATPEAIAQLDALATQFQKTTVFSDDLITSMEALLVQVGHVAPNQMQLALTAATNLAAGLGIDLRTATLAVAKSFDEGGTSALTRLVPGLKGIIKDGATTEQVLQTINEQFGPQAQAQMRTYAGQVAVLSNQWNDFQERAGGVVAGVLTPLLQLLESLPQPIQTVIFAVTELGQVLAPLAVGISAVVTSLGGWAAAWAGATAVFSGLMGWLAALVPYLGPAGIIATGVGAWIYVFKNLDVIVWAVQQVYEGVKHWMVDMFHAGIVEPIKAEIELITGAFKWMRDQVVTHSYVPDMIDGIGVEISRLDTVMVGPVQSTTAMVSGAFKAMGDDVIAVFATLPQAADAASKLIQDAYAKAGFITHPIISQGPGPLGLNAPEPFGAPSGARASTLSVGDIHVSLGPADRANVREMSDQIAERIFQQIKNSGSPLTWSKA